MQSHPRSLLLFLAALFLVSGCGSSSSTATAPAPATRCSITLNSATASMPATGGSGTLGVVATRECAWSASVEGGGWLSIRTGASGQGEGTVEFVAAANPDPQTRAGGVVVNGTRAQITQAAGECVMSLGTSSADFAPAGGSTRVEVRASSALCSWTAASDAPWIDVTSGGTGRGNGEVAIAVAPTTGPPRTGSLTIAGQHFSVTQSQGCTYVLDRSSQSLGAAGGSGSVTITTGPACPWTAASNADWLSVATTSGAGPGAVTFTVAPTQGPQRSGTALIAGQLFTVTQSPGCAFDVEPAAHNVPAAGGSASVAVGTAQGCSWTASSNASWITIQGPASGSGPGSVAFSVAATNGPSRSGTLTVAGRQVTVTQTQGCTYAITPQRQSFGATGGTGRIAVSSGAGCAWTAASGASWVTITSGASGSGNGDVQFTVAATTGPARTASVTVAGQTFVVEQGQGCTYRLSSASTEIDDGGGTGTFDVQTAGGCGWTATTATSWISITSGASGSGNGTVRFTAAPNSGPGRTGSITAGGQTFTVTQGTGCTFTVSPDRQNVPNAGGTGSFTVAAGAGCGWTAGANAPWLTIASGGSGSGSGTVTFSAAANNEAARSGTLTIAGRTVTVEQASGCTYALSPASRAVPAGGGATTVDVATQGSCAWTAAANVPWIAITGGSAGSGNGTVQMTVEPNGGAARTGTVTAAGQTFTVTQDSGCTFTLAPNSTTVPGAGGGTRTDVTAAAGCAWTATANVPWITVTSGSPGSGSGAVQMSVDPNSGAARAGTVTVAGQTFTVNQDTGCSFTVAPETITAPAAGGPSRVDVTAAAGCAWSAASAVPWITITSSATGSGNGAVDLSIAANGGAARSGTLTVAGRTVTVSQDSGCAITLTPATQTVAATGGTGTITVTTAAGCPWTAASSAAWVTITSGASGAGDGAVQFSVDANVTGAPRSATITIGGQTFTVEQQ